MRIMIQMSILAVVDVDEGAGMTAKVSMPTPKFSMTQVMIPSRSEEIPDAEATRDFTLIAAAHVLKFISDGAQTNLESIGEPVMTQQRGDA